MSYQIKLTIQENIILVKILADRDTPFHQGWQRELQSNLPGVTWDTATQEWIIPQHKISVSALREIFTKYPVPGGNENIDVSPNNTFNILKKIADKEQQNIYLSEDGKKILFDIPKWHKYEKTLMAVGWVKNKKKNYELNSNKAKDVINLFNDKHPEISISPDIIKLSKKKESPLKDVEFLSLKDLQNTGISTLNSVTPSVLNKLNKIGIYNIYDLITFYPKAYVNRTEIYNPATLKTGDEVTFIGKIISISSNSHGNRKSLKYVLENTKKERISATFFNQKWLSSKFKESMDVILYGKYDEWVNPKTQRKTKQITNPKIEHLGTEHASIPFLPLYKQFPSLKITNSLFSKVFEELVSRIKDNHIIDIPFLDTPESLTNIHLPSTVDKLNEAKTDLIEQELTALQIFIQKNKKSNQEADGIQYRETEYNYYSNTLKKLPYSLTEGQEEALTDIKTYMYSNRPMHRLIQGDVGSGKTTIAYLSALIAIENKKQVAVIAPTEILAAQLYDGFVSLTNELTEIKVNFLGGKQTSKTKQSILKKIKNNETNIVFGTHAILQKDVEFKDLGLVIIDEQHRFGVEQRTSIIKSRTDNYKPDVLAMTATPIPRTSALIIYGDMDITTIKDLPPGRTPVETKYLNIDNSDVFKSAKIEPWYSLRKEIEQNHQAYVIAPLVEDNEKFNLKSVNETANNLKELFPDYRIGEIYGSMKKEEKDAVLEDFRLGNIEILVSTTVIEVGINVPNATSIVILHAERFGISQLHQLRGRVGRSDLESQCFLISDSNNVNSIRRLKAIEGNNDGFILAEEDLRIRGEGSVFGNEQSGLTDLKIASISSLPKVEKAKEKADDILKNRELTSLEKEYLEIIFNNKTISS